MELGAIVGIAGAVGGFALYVIRAEMRGDVTRLDGRINTHEKGCEVRQTALADKLDHMDAKLDHVADKLDRIAEDR